MVLFGGILMVASVAIELACWLCQSLPVMPIWPATDDAGSFCLHGDLLDAVFEANLTTARAATSFRWSDKRWDQRVKAWLDQLLLLLYSAVAAYISGGGDG